jgi:hypothetical protein
MLSTYQATRYLVPLREGGSLPAVLDTEGGGLFVAKFRGAGQGARALIAEIIVGGLAQHLELPVPEIALIEINEDFGRSEGDPEIQDILRASHGTNVGLSYLEGAFNFDAVANLENVDPSMAARIVWLDALVLNLDRTSHNTNLLLWGTPSPSAWLIDHGAALYFHHDWDSVTPQTASQAFPLIKNHVLLPRADSLDTVDELCASVLTPEVIEAVVNDVPDSLLLDAPAGIEQAFETGDAARAAYCEVLSARVSQRAAFLAEANRAQLAERENPKTQKSYRR